MFTLCVLIITFGVSCATNCYELQQSQISSLNDRMAQMLNTFYTPLAPNPATVPTAPDYGSPYEGYPYSYAPPQNTVYAPPAYYTPSPIQIKPATKPPYYNIDHREYPAFNWANYYENYPHYSEVDRSQYNLMSYQTPPPPYPLTAYVPPPYVPPCSPSPPLPPYPSWEHPLTSEYPSYNYPSYGQPAPRLTPWAPQPPPPAPYPSPLYHRYAEVPPPAPYFY